MQKIEWDSSFSVHVPEIDEQHKKWIALINDLHEMLLTGVGLSGTVRSKLIEMRDYGRVHFAYEEHYLESIGYPQLEEHRQEHRHFLAKVEGYLITEEYLLHSEVMQILMRWMKNHILHSDQKYVIQPEKGDDR